MSEYDWVDKDYAVSPRKIIVSPEEEKVSRPVRIKIDRDFLTSN